MYRRRNISKIKLAEDIHALREMLFLGKFKRKAVSISITYTKNRIKGILRFKSENGWKGLFVFRKINGLVREEFFSKAFFLYLVICNSEAA